MKLCPPRHAGTERSYLNFQESWLDLRIIASNSLRAGLTTRIRGCMPAVGTATPKPRGRTFILDSSSPHRRCPRTDLPRLAERQSVLPFGSPVNRFLREQGASAASRTHRFPENIPARSSSHTSTSFPWCTNRRYARTARARSGSNCKRTQSTVKKAGKSLWPDVAR